MTDQELELRLKAALRHTAPDDINAILSLCGPEKGKVSNMPGRNVIPGRKSRKWGLIAACLALLLLGGGAWVIYQQTYAVASIISLDVNPGVELRVNQKERVLSCAAVNDDAAAVLADMDGGKDLEGSKLDVAVNAVVGALVRSGYLNRLDSALLISVEDKDTDRAARLQQELETSVGVLLQSSDSRASVLGQSIAPDTALDEQARQNSISSGKAYFVDQVIGLNDTLDFDQLAALTVEELRDMLQTGAPAMPIGKAAAIRAACAYAGVSESRLSFIEADPDLDERIPCYEVELELDGREYDYVIDAYTGRILSGEKDITSPAAVPSPDPDDGIDSPDPDDDDWDDGTDGPDPDDDDDRDDGTDSPDPDDDDDWDNGDDDEDDDDDHDDDGDDDEDDD